MTAGRRGPRPRSDAWRERRGFSTTRWTAPGGRPPGREAEPAARVEESGAGRRLGGSGRWGAGRAGGVAGGGAAALKAAGRAGGELTAAERASEPVGARAPRPRLLSAPLRARAGRAGRVSPWLQPTSSPPRPGVPRALWFWGAPSLPGYPEAGRQPPASRLASPENARPARRSLVPPLRASAPPSFGLSFCLCLCLCLSLSGWTAPCPDFGAQAPGAARLQGLSPLGVRSPSVRALVPAAPVKGLWS